jgi:hypothetical protein
MIIGMQIRRHLVSALVTSVILAASLNAHADVPAAAATAPTVVASNAPAEAPSNQIWECTTKGVRTFSSNPCGTNPTLRELNPINVMEPAPAYHVTHAHPAAQAPAAANYAYPNPDAGDANNADNTNAYPGYIVVTRIQRARTNSSRNHPRPHQ